MWVVVMCCLARVIGDLVGLPVVLVVVWVWI